ncbi:MULTISPECIES: hypothetical protein [Alphaproteobacteria]
MKFWSIAVVVLVLVGAAASRASNPSHVLSDHPVSTGVPVTTLHTPATP